MAADGAAPITLTALELRDRLVSGALSVADLAEAMIARIESREPDVEAWSWFDPTFVREQARGLDAYRKVMAMKEIDLVIATMAGTARRNATSSVPPRTHRSSSW